MYIAHRTQILERSLSTDTGSVHMESQASRDAGSAAEGSDGYKPPLV